MSINDFGSDREILGSSLSLGASFAVDISEEVLHIDVNRVSVPGITIDEGTCSTILGQTCIFPFTFKGKLYQECTDDGTWTGHRYWCPTKVDDDGIFVEGSKSWGTCSATCQIIQRAVLPMINGQVEDILVNSVHPAVDLRRPLNGSLKDALELTNTSLSVADGAFRVWTSFNLSLTSWMNQHFGLNTSRRLT